MTAETIAAAMPRHTPTVLPTETVEAGKGGEGGDFQITNAEFIAAVFTDLPEGAFAAVCSKSGDPDLGGWLASRADQVANSLAAEKNNYVGCSSFYPRRCHMRRHFTSERRYSEAVRPTFAN